MDKEREALIHEAARAAAKETLDDFVVRMGFDPDHPQELQEVLSNARAWNNAHKIVRRAALRTTAAVFVTGVLALLWLGVKHELKSFAKWLGG